MPSPGRANGCRGPVIGRLVRSTGNGREWPKTCPRTRRCQLRGSGPGVEHGRGDERVRPRQPSLACSTSNLTSSGPQPRLCIGSPAHAPRDAREFFCSHTSIGRIVSTERLTVVMTICRHVQRASVRNGSAGQYRHASVRNRPLELHADVSEGAAPRSARQIAGLSRLCVWWSASAGLPLRVESECSRNSEH